MRSAIKRKGKEHSRRGNNTKRVFCSLILILFFGVFFRACCGRSCFAFYRLFSFLNWMASNTFYFLALTRRKQTENTHVGRSTTDPTEVESICSCVSVYFRCICLSPVPTDPRSMKFILEFFTPQNHWQLIWVLMLYLTRVFHLSPNICLVVISISGKRCSAWAHRSHRPLTHVRFHVISDI